MSICGINWYRSAVLHGAHRSVHRIARCPFALSNSQCGTHVAQVPQAGLELKADGSHNPMAHTLLMTSMQRTVA